MNERRSPTSRPFGSESETQPEIRLPSESATRSGTRRRPDLDPAKQPGTLGRIKIGTFSEVPPPKQRDPRRD